MIGKIWMCNLAVAVLLAGCAVLRDAREAQERVAERARDDAPRAAAAEVTLAGRSLRELVDFALTNRPSMTSKRLAVEDARLALKQLRASAPVLSDTPWTAPQLSVKGGYDASGDPMYWDDLSAKTRGDASAGLSLSILLYDFGRYDAAAAAARENVIAAEQSLVDAGYGVFKDVATAYFGFLEKTALLDVARTNELEFVAHLEEAEGRNAAGEAKRLDVLKARLNLASARESTVSASNAVACAGVELVRVLGLEAGVVKPADLAALAAGALAHPRRAFAPTAATADELYAFARTNAPAMRVARAQLRAAKADVDAAVADLLPEISASSSLSWGDPFWIWSWGVGVSQSLFQGFRKTTAVERAVVALEQSAANVDELEQQCSSDIATAVSVRDNAREKIATAATALAQALENLETVRAEYGVGDATRIDYAAAVAAYVTELGNHIEAIYVAELAEAALFKLTGRLPVYHEGNL